MKKHIITFFKGLGACSMMVCAAFGLVMGVVALFILHTLPAWAAIGLFLLDVAWLAMIILLIWCVGLFVEDC